MQLGVGGKFGEPGAGNHDAGGRGRVLVEGVETGGVFRVGDSKIVGVDDKKLGIARVAEALSEGFGLGRSAAAAKRDDDDGDWAQTHGSLPENPVKSNTRAQRGDVIEVGYWRTSHDL